jgi:hypothetical protein
MRSFSTLAASRCSSDVARLVHPFDDVLLADRRAARVVDGVVGGGRLGQAGQHGCLGDADLVQRLAEIDLAGRCETVRAVAEEDLIHVDLEDLLLGQGRLDLQRQQDLVDLAGEGLLGRQVEVARHLHRDRRCTLAARFADIGQAGADDAEVVHAAMLVEARVLDRQHRFLHQFGDLLDGPVAATLLAELAQQHAVAGQHPHRQLGAVVGQPADIRQIRIGQRQGQGEQQKDGRDGATQQPQPPQRPAAEAAA